MPPRGASSATPHSDNDEYIDINIADSEPGVTDASIHAVGGLRPGGYSAI